MTTRNYVSPKRAAQAAETRRRILDAFRHQLVEGTHDTLSPTEAAQRAGCSVRTVHGHFPTTESRVEALAEHLDAELYPDGFDLPRNADDLPDHYRRIHEAALGSQLATALLSRDGAEWRAIRARRRAVRLDAIRHAVAAIEAPETATDDALGVLLALAGGEVALTMSDEFGVDPARVPASIAHTVELIVADLRRTS